MLSGSVEILKRFPRIRSFSEPERSSYGARNLAIRQAEGDILAFTDSDCYPAAGWLKAIDACFRDNRAEVLLGQRLPASVSEADFRGGPIRFCLP